ncbi:MAG: sulfite exporter TauE/SafE family protein [Pseudolabrys sp.]
MFVGAALYTSVGHGGASSYIALMALFSVPAAVMRPTALALNIIVSTLGTWRYASAGFFRWRAIWPFMAGAVPFAFLGGGIQLPGNLYRPIVGVVLLFAGVSLLWLREVRPLNAVHDPPIWLGILVGAGIGLLAGLTGTGGGIFLSPIIIFLGWADIRTASGCAAVFILGNSIAGLAGNFAAVQSLPPQLPVYVVAVVLGAIVGTTFGTRLPIVYIQRALGIVLLIAGAKLIGAD